MVRLSVSINTDQMLYSCFFTGTYIMTIFLAAQKAYRHLIAIKKSAAAKAAASEASVANL